MERRPTGVIHKQRGLRRRTEMDQKAEPQSNEQEDSYRKLQMNRAQYIRGAGHTPLQLVFLFLLFLQSEIHSYSMCFRFLSLFSANSANAHVQLLSRNPDTGEFTPLPHPLPLKNMAPKTSQSFPFYIRCTETTDLTVSVKVNCGWLALLSRAVFWPSVLWHFRVMSATPLGFSLCMWPAIISRFACSKSDWQPEDIHDTIN